MKRIIVNIKKITALILVICLTFNFTAVNAAAVNKPKPERFTVLVLDTSTFTNYYNSDKLIYTAESAIEYVKKGALKFVEDLKKDDNANYVAIVEFYADTANVVHNFTTDIGSLSEKINKLEVHEEGRSIAEGLDTAYDLLSNVTTDNATKNVVLFSTGSCSNGDFAYSGKYTKSTIGSEWYNEETGIHLYAYSNTAYNSANKIKEDLGAIIYSIWFYEPYAEMPKKGADVVSFFKMVATDLATSADHFYAVSDSENIEFAFGNVSEQILETVITGYFLGSSNYLHGTSKDYEVPYRYSDNYFINSSYEYSKELALMSMCLAWSAFGSNETRSFEELEHYGPDYTKYSQNAEKLLREIGFWDVTTNEHFKTKPTLDSIGVIAGHKTINDGNRDYTLVAVAVRGGGYESEWGSNLTIGKEGQHQGFEEARDGVIEFLKEYIKKIDVSGDVKLWITGYSRAAATSNLTAAELDINAEKHFGNKINLVPDNIYAYCLEAPQGTLKEIDNEDKVYDNIFNIINPVDFVTKVAMDHYSFTRYGTDIFIPSVETDGEYATKRDKMLEIFNSLESSKKYTIDYFKAKTIMYNESEEESNNILKKISMLDYLNEFMLIVARDIVKTRESYVNEYQVSAREICSLTFGSLFTNPADFTAFAKELEDNLWDDIVPLAWFLSNGDIVGLSVKVKNLVIDAIVEAGIDDYDEKALDEVVNNLVPLLLKFVPHLGKVINFIINVNTIADAHRPELCYSWLASFVDMETNGDYRVIHINCPVNVSVYDSSGVLVSKIENNVLVELEDGYDYAYIDLDDSKEVVLPVNEAYIVEIYATDTGKVDVSVKEFCAEIGNYSSVKNYYDIYMTNGDKLVLNVPEVPSVIMSESTADGTGVIYTLINNDGEEVEPSICLTGENAHNAYHHVNVTKNINEAGIVYGSGSKQVGEYSKLEVYPFENYEFVGWYENNNLLSAEKEFRVRVDKEWNIEARFNKADVIDTPTPAPDNIPEKVDIDKGNNLFKYALWAFLTFVVVIAFFAIYTKNKKRNKR